MSDLIRAGRHISECSRHSGCLNLFEGLCWRVFTCTVADLDDSDRVPSLHGPALQHNAEYPLAGEDTVAGYVIDCTTGVAHLSYLADLCQHFVTKLELRAQGQRQKVDALDCEILPEGSLVHGKAELLCLLDGLQGEERHLAVPISGMGVAFDAGIGQRAGRRLPKAPWGCPSAGIHSHCGSSPRYAILRPSGMRRFRYATSTSSSSTSLTGRFSPSMWMSFFSA